MTWNETEHPRDDRGQFINKDGIREYRQNTSYSEILADDKAKAESEEKIDKVHIDISKDNVLPQLTDKALREMGLTKNKNVLVKKSSIDRNLIKHSDVKPEQFDFLIGNTLYSPDRITKGKNEKGIYFSFTKRLTISDRGNVLHGVVLLDVTMNKEQFEVVHWHFVKEKGLKSI